jgi:hypothetical protein
MGWGSCPPKHREFWKLSCNNTLAIDLRVYNDLFLVENSKDSKTKRAVEIPEDFKTIKKM